MTMLMMPTTMLVFAPVPGLAFSGTRYCGSQRFLLAVHRASVEPQLYIAEACAEIESAQTLEAPEVQDAGKKVHPRLWQGTYFGGVTAVVRQLVGAAGVAGDPRHGGHGIVLV
ncbi:MAG: hypothetical protein WCJ67_09480 [Thermoleophilia bacterium]